MKKIEFGIRKDLQADIRHEPNACDGFVLDLSLGCRHQCNYCIFSPLEHLAYRLMNPAHDGKVIPLKLDRLLERQDFPPAVYMCYSSDPLAGKDMAASTKTVLKKLFAHDVRVLFITKGVFTDDVLDIIAMRPDLMDIQVGLTSSDWRRNRLIEPGVPDFEARLANFEKLASINGLLSLAIRMDPLFPVIDDSRENIEAVLGRVSNLGVRQAVCGYVMLTEKIREQLKDNPYLTESMQALSEKTPTISGRPLYGFPLAEKLEKLEEIHALCKKMEMNMSVCGCKDERLKNHDIPWVCHSFKAKEKRHEICWEA